MDHDDATAALREAEDLLFFLRRKIAAPVAVDEEDVGVVEFGLGRGAVCAGGLSAPGVEERYPVSEEGGVIVGSGSVTFGAGADEDAQGRFFGGSCGEKDQRGKEAERGVFHGGSRVRRLRQDNAGSRVLSAGCGFGIFEGGGVQGGLAGGVGSGLRFALGMRLKEDSGKG